MHLDPLALFATFVPLVFAITTHEAAHGFVASYFGDMTAKNEGRVTLNPIAHVDLLGTIIFPVMQLMASSPMFFGWAKPVPVDFFKLKPPRLGLVLVAFAGPFVNILIAFFSALLLHINKSEHTLAYDLLVNSVSINIVIAAFNLLPIPPLDGGRILVGLLPRELARPLAMLEPYGFFIIMGLIFIPHLIGIDLLRMVLMPIYTLIRYTVLFLSGHMS